MKLWCGFGELFCLFLLYHFLHQDMLNWEGVLFKSVCVREILNLHHMLWIRLNLKTWCWQRHLTLDNHFFHCPLLPTSVGLFLQLLPGYIQVNGAKMKKIVCFTTSDGLALNTRIASYSGWWSVHLLILTSSNKDLRVTVSSSFCFSLFNNNHIHFLSSLFSQI